MQGKSTVRFATLRLRRRPGRDGCQSALWDCFGEQICSHVENASPKTVPQCLMGFNLIPGVRFFHTAPCISGSGEDIECGRGILPKAKRPIQHAEWLWCLVMSVRKLSESQPRTQASSRCPSYQRRFGTEYDSGKVWQAWQVTSHPKSPRTAGDEAEWIRFYSRLLYWQNWPEIWFTQFPNSNHQTSEPFGVLQNTPAASSVLGPNG